MATHEEWSDRVKRMLKAELKRQGVTYEELAQRLTSMGIPESAANIANKISRGGFSAAFLVQCLTAIGTRALNI